MSNLHLACASFPTSHHRIPLLAPVHQIPACPLLPLLAARPCSHCQLTPELPKLLSLQSHLLHPPCICSQKIASFLRRLHCLGIARTGPPWVPLNYYQWFLWSELCQESTLLPIKFQLPSVQVRGLSPFHKSTLLIPTRKALALSLSIFHDQFQSNMINKAYLN